MGWQQRSRRIGREDRCYICEKPIFDGEKANRDHVPPKRIFASAVRKQYNPNLQSLPTHESCNYSHHQDEEYFVVCFAGHVNSAPAAAVMKDIAEAVAKGHGIGVLKEVISQFGTVVGPNGELMYTVKGARVQRFLRKLVRGLYTLETGDPLPESKLTQVYLIDPRDPGPELEKLGWFPTVRDTHPLAQYGAVFDYKWLCWKDGELRGHAMAMLFWDGLIAATLFHDPACECEHC